MAAHGAHNSHPIDYIWELIVREGRSSWRGSWRTDAAFNHYALSRPAFSALLTDPFYADDLTDDQRRRLKAVLGRIDRLGQAVRGKLPLDDCVPGLMDRLGFWLAASVAPGLRGALGETLVQDMADRLRRSIRSYQYDVDFWAWAQPLLVDELLMSLSLRGRCADGLSEQLVRDAETCMTAVYGTHGVYGVDVRAAAARALLVTLRNSDDALQPISAVIAHDALRAEVKRFAVDAALPVMDWTQVPDEQEDAEYRKRIRLLEEFNRLVRG